MKKVIITGVTGQDGSYMADYLLENTQHEIFGMVGRTAKPDYSNLNQALKNPRFKLVSGELANSSSLETLVREIQPDHFINFAGQSFVELSWKIPEQNFESVALGVMWFSEAE